MPIGEMCRMMVSKLDWFGTLFPRLPVNVQKDLEAKLREYKMAARSVSATLPPVTFPRFNTKLCATDWQRRMDRRMML